MFCGQVHFNDHIDHIEFHYGPIGKIMGYFAARGAWETVTEILATSSTWRKPMLSRVKIDIQPPRG
jgi:hypothetical protein